MRGRAIICWLAACSIGVSGVKFIGTATDAWAGQNAATADRVAQADQQSEQQPAAGPDLTSNDTCLACHGNPGFAMPRADGTTRSLYIEKTQFSASVHGKALVCVSCHTKISQIPHNNVAQSLIEWRQSIPPLCGNCHAGELAQYMTSVHGREVMQAGNPNAAVCSDCHSAHGIEVPTANSFRLAIVKECGGCHQANLRSYLQTYHGQVTTLGYGSTAKCYDCHGSHTIQRVDDPSSTVYPANRLATCRKCHSNATPGFITFQPHATTNNFEKYPYTWLASKFMFLLILGTFLFFWTHSAFWYYRELRDHFSGARRMHVQTADLVQGKTVYYRRWSAMWRLAHLGFAICTIMLIFTGMTLFYANSYWAPAVQRMFGGPPTTGTIHRIFAVSWLSIFFAHLCYVTVRIAKNWRTFRWFGPTSMVANWEDVTDIIKMYKWFLGRGPKPLFDKWTYWEKFDYWAPFWGATIVGVTGAMLWFKYLTASILPGWVLNVATIFHGEEAFLAAAFLFTVHFFNNHWRPENFPLDILMFTGVMPLEKFRREHTLEYNRLVETDQLKDYLVEAPSRPMAVGSTVLGFVLMAAGLILLAFIIVGFVRSLGGG
jgi:cytochrome b subunit of formate dehydrogenase